MARSKAPFASIPHLIALTRLYSESRGIYPENKDSKEYADALNEHLALSGVISGGSKNLSSKLRGFPYHASMELCDEGIDIDKLDLVSKIVLEHYSSKIPVKKVSSSPWADFQKAIFEVPEYFKYIQQYKYYKYLNSADQKSIDGFVERMLNQLDLGINQVYNYCLYFLSREYNSTFIAILQIDKQKKVAMYTQYAYVGDEWKLRSAQTTDRPNGEFELRNNSLWIDLVEEDREKKQIRITLTLAALDSDLFHTEFVKGMLQSSAENSTVPMGCTCLIQRVSSYREACDLATNQKPHDPDIDIELLNGRTEVHERKLTSKEKFRTAQIAKIVKKIAGAYIIGWLAKPPAHQKGSIILARGICFIYENGLMKWQKDRLEEIQGRVLTDTSYGHDIICFADFFTNGLSEYKYQYFLEVKKENQVVILEGTYHGINHLPQTGAIIFIKKPEYKTFEELREREGVDCGHVHFDKVASEDDKFMLNKILNNNYIIIPKPDIAGEKSA